MDFSYLKHVNLDSKHVRDKMPQIDLIDIPDAIVHLVKNGLVVKKTMRKLKNIKPTQKDFIDEKIIEKIKNDSEQYKSRKYIISNEGYLVDGHHDWAHGLEMQPDHVVNCFLVDCPIDELLGKLTKFRKSTEEDLEKAGQSNKYGAGKKMITVEVRTKSGRVYRRKQLVGTEEKVKKKKQKKQTDGEDKKKAWWGDLKQHNLNVYPVGIPEKDVTVDLDGDIHSKAVLKWKDPKTGREKRAYTEQFMKNSAAKKWNRIKQIKSKDVERIKNGSAEIMLSPESSESKKEAAAIISIISQTGLRPGSTKGFNETGNRGVSTLAKENIKIEGDTIKLDFQGKSYQQNTAEIKDEVLAGYLKDKMKDKKASEMMFSTSKATISKTFKDDLGMGDFKIKDLRTWIATDTARKILFYDKTPPPPLGDSPEENKKLIQNKLNVVFDKVSNKLNNTPAMAKNSYVHPIVVEAFMWMMGQPKLEKAEQPKFRILSMDEIIDMFADRHENVEFDIDEEDEEETEGLFSMPDFMEDEDTKKTDKSMEEIISKAFEENTNLAEEHLTKFDNFNLFSDELKVELEKSLENNIFEQYDITIDGVKTTKWLVYE